MDSIFPILAVGFFIVVFALIAYYSYQQQQQRLAEMSALARELNWQFVADEDYSYDGQYSQFDCFCRGHSRYAFNTLLGTINVGGQACAARMGDYHYKITSHTGKTSSTRTYRFSYLLVDLPYPSLPDLQIRREGLFDALAGVFGFDDIDFESSEFSKRFHVKSSDKKFAFDVVHPAMMEYLLAEEPPSIEIERSQCCLTDGNSTWSPVEFQERFIWATKFFDLWPKHLVAEFKSR